VSQYQANNPFVGMRKVRIAMTTASNAKAGLRILIAIAMTSRVSFAAKPASRPMVPQQEQPAVEHFAHAAQALDRVLATPAQVVAFGEYHQTAATRNIPSSLLRFIDELLPAVAKLATDLVVETWVADGHCGRQESKVVEEVQTTTERPPETEGEIVTLLKRAKAAGMMPHILTLSCKDYRSVTGRGGETDFAKMLTLTRDRLQGEVTRALVVPRPAASSHVPRVAVYGGALHNDLYPASGDRPFAFGRALFAKVKGQYLEVDLVVPEYILGDQHLATEPWFDAFKAGIKAGDALLIRRSERSYIIVFPTQSAASHQNE
jgi:hypothetical protein